MQCTWIISMPSTRVFLPGRLWEISNVYQGVLYPCEDLMMCSNSSSIKASPRRARLSRLSSLICLGKFGKHAMSLYSMIVNVFDKVVIFRTINQAIEFWSLAWPSFPWQHLVLVIWRPFVVGSRSSSMVHYLREMKTVVHDSLLRILQRI